MDGIITTVATAIAIPLVFQLLYLLRLREEKKHKSNNTNRTKAPKAVMWFFIIAAIFFFAIMVIACACMIAGGEPFSTIAIVLSIFALFTILSLVGCFYARFRYEVFDDEKVTAYRFFLKPRTFYYKDITFYCYNQGAIGDFKAYDKNGMPLFSQENIYLGLDDLIAHLVRNDVKNVPPDYFVKHMKDNEVFLRYRKRTHVKIAAWFAFALGLMCIALFGIIFGSGNYERFENRPVNGIVRSYEFNENGSVTLMLADDDGIYYINGLSQKALDKSLATDIESGDEIALCISYTDKRGRHNISQLEFNGKIYLRAEAAEKIERDNYDKLLTTSYVFLGLSAALIAAWIVLTIVYRTKFKPI